MHILFYLMLAVVGFVPATGTANPADAVNRVGSGDFDAVSTVRCAQDIGRSVGDCRAAVARAGTAAAVVVTFANGFARTLTFEDGRFLRGNATMSGVGTDTDWQLTDGTYFVRVDDQRFELPAWLVLGEQAAPTCGCGLSPGQDPGVSL